MLPHGDPEAIQSRRELRLINGIMGNHRFLSREIQRVIKSQWRVLELGAGDGTFGAQLVAHGICRPEQLVGLDLAPRPALWPEKADWIQGDLFSVPMPAAEVVIANLFLHHFESSTLAKIGARRSSTCRILLANEPARRGLHIAQGRLLSWFARLGRVTRHDMIVSIRAGFSGDELPHALGLQKWKTSVSTTLLGAYRLVALKP